ncbi:hypothetical protein Pyn_39711 [Prunus yedoensis var. nudiflora]|uniref:Uncharacterized protein n=1 Tax=Prunus yedoensis var. nudiflora TaxID=2094558 RepID=A0A314Y1P1_PRUYE|nr:hypothetical protein Pyn_39711 [Prunus yedoensis var. nudiflora]
MSQRDSLATDGRRLNALEEESLKHKMLRIDSKRLPLRLKRSCTDVLNPSLMAGNVTEHWIQIQRLEQALHITQIDDVGLNIT